MEKWQQEVSVILAGFETSSDQIAQTKYEEFVTYLDALPQTGDVVTRMRRLGPEAKVRFADLIRRLEDPGFRLPEGEVHDAHLFAAMNVVAWYLHQAWRSEHQTLSLSCARSLAFVLMVGLELGRLERSGDSR